MNNQLTPRQAEVFEMLKDGPKTCREIWRQLNVTNTTAHYHVNNLYKVGLIDFTERLSGPGATPTKVWHICEVTKC